MKNTVRSGVDRNFCGFISSFIRWWLLFFWGGDAYHVKEGLGLLEG